MASVREDFAPFDVSVTADPATYASWAGNRVRVALVASVSDPITGLQVGGGSCGAAMLYSYTMMDNVVWVAGCGPVCGSKELTVAQTVSHEVGHTFGLFHDGYDIVIGGVTQQHVEYLAGEPLSAPLTWPNSRKWNSIMGLTSDWGLTQWSDGSYAMPASGVPSATEDDVSQIRDATGARASASCNQVPYTTIPQTHRAA
jgi:hypothetical protein